MIAILDTNILISALLVPRSLPARLVDAWTEQRFDLVTSEEQIDEFRRVSRYSKVAKNISASRAGHLIRQIRKNATVLAALPLLDISPDPFDNFLLALAQFGKADYLVTGDKAHLLALDKHGSTKIVAVRHFADLLDI